MTALSLLLAIRYLGNYCQYYIAVTFLIKLTATRSLLKVTRLKQTEGLFTPK
jgi:hypothetical protein